MNIPSDVTTTVYKPEKEKSYAQKRLEELTSAAESLSDAAKEAPKASVSRILNALIKHARRLDGSQYASDGWRSLMKALSKAEGTALSDGASIAAIKKVMSELQSALGALVPAEKEDDGLREGFPLTSSATGQFNAPAQAEASATVDISL